VRATIWGCRGSIPTPGAETVRYGGNTSCVELALDDGTVLVFDAGTGIRNLGGELLGRGTRRVHLLLTHLHLDHLEGLRFFGPMWDPGVEVDIWGPPSPTMALHERIARAFSPPLFPVELADVPAEVKFHDIPRRRWRIGDAILSGIFVVHPGPTVGYRVEQNGSSLAYIPDHEPALAGSIEGRTLDWLSGAQVAAGADLLFHDAQYSEEEYPDRIGWGHSSVADAVAFADAVGVRRMLMFHHDPQHSDADLEALEARARSLSRNGLQPELAREGMVLELG
jgi:phosphoribosyl 1,2-cyclic phosphodiesterase